MSKSQLYRAPAKYTIAVATVLFLWLVYTVLQTLFVIGYLSEDWSAILAAILPVSTWQGWSWKAALLYAPASGISQELFFRSSLFPALQLILKKHRGLALHALLFGLWHIGPLFVGAPIWAVAAVMLVPFVSGLGWGWEVHRDKTVLWAMIQHSLIWVIGLQFAMPG